MKSWSLVSGVVRSTLAQTRAQGSRDVWNSQSVGYDRWLSALGPEMVWIRYSVDLDQDYRCSTCGEVNGKHANRDGPGQSQLDTWSDKYVEVLNKC
jgi:hypothetical protein